jgi:hypothetical protein
MIIVPDDGRAKVRAYDNEATHTRRMQLYFTPAIRAALSTKLQARDRDTRGKLGPGGRPPGLQPRINARAPVAELSQKPYLIVPLQEALLSEGRLPKLL